jgi:hypothetical protein
MLLFDLGEMGTREPVRKTNQRWPEPSMNEGDFATYNATNKNIIAVSHRAGPCEYLFALWMGPPTSLDRPLRDRLCQGGNRTTTRLQHDTMFSNKFDSLVGSHLWPIDANPRAWVLSSSTTTATTLRSFTLNNNLPTAGSVCGSLLTQN